MSEEKIFTIPIKKLVKKVPRWKNANKSIKAIKKFLNRHLKSEFVIHNSVNEKIWEKGNRNLITKLKVRAVKNKEKWNVYLFGYKITKEDLESKVKKQLKKEEVKEEVKENKKETKKEEKKEEKKKIEEKKKKEDNKK